MSRKSFSIIAAAVLVALAPAASGAQELRVCSTRDVIVDKLQTQFKEKRQSYGLQQHAGVYEVFASDEGSWTIIVTAPSGMTCVIAAGEAWSHDKSAAAQPGDPA